jgi:hypothetical protein
MRHVAFLLSLLIAILSVANLYAQPAGPPAPPAPRDEMGLKLAGVPEALAAHLPALERGQGLLVEAIRPGSRAADIGLKTYDVVLAVGTTPVKTGDDVQAKLLGLRPGEREVLQIIRGGKPFALSIASPGPMPTANTAYMPPKSLFKPGGPPAVSFEHKQLPGGRLEVHLVYLNSANKMEGHALQGSLEHIEAQVMELCDQGQMSESVHDLVGLALKRLRSKTAPSSK